MTLLQWKDTYSVGVAAVDHEHRELIDLINRLHDRFTAGGPAAAEPFFGDLLCAISAHFALEERFMRGIAYREFASHKDDHERLLEELRDLMEDAAEGRPAADLSRRLEAWFTQHFHVHDAPLHKALNRRTT
jgi:hemerythrin